MLQLLPSSISQQIPHGRNLDFDSKHVVSSEADGLREETGEFFKSLMARNESPTSSLARNPWFSETVEVSEELSFWWSWFMITKSESKGMEAAEMCDHFCDGSRGMDDFCWVEVQSKLTYHKIASFLGFFRWDSKFMSKFRQFLEVNQKIGWKPDFPAKFEDFFSFQKMVTTWCFSGPTIGGGCDLDLLCHVPRNSFFFGTWYYHRQVFSASLFPMTDLWQRLHVVKVSKG